jgi:hypothetical protein
LSFANGKRPDTLLGLPLCDSLHKLVGCNLSRSKILLDTPQCPHAIINLTPLPTRPPTGEQPPDWRMRLSDKRAENIPTSILCPLIYFNFPTRRKTKCSMM